MIKQIYTRQGGVSMIATMLTLLFLAVFAAVVVSLVLTASSVGMQEEQGLQALYIAESGLQYAPLIYNFPYYITPAAIAFGQGTFTTAVPQLTAAITAADTTIPVNSTDGFVQAPDGQYWVMIAATTNPLTTSDLLEKISFAGMTATTFTGGTRGMESSVPAAHPMNASVLLYTWNPAIATTLVGPSGVGPTICVASVAGFAPAGFIKITGMAPGLNEDIQYSGTSTSPAACGGCAACFTGCLRGAYYGGAGNPHPPGSPVYQVEISVLATSTGIVPGGPFAGNVQRKVQAAIMPLE